MEWTCFILFDMQAYVHQDLMTYAMFFYIFEIQANVHDDLMTYANVNRLVPNLIRPIVPPQ